MTLFELFLAGVIIFPIVQSETNVCENPIVCLTENTFSFCFLVNGTEEVLVGNYSCGSQELCTQDPVHPCQNAFSTTDTTVPSCEEEGCKYPASSCGEYYELVLQTCPSGESFNAADQTCVSNNYSCDATTSIPTTQTDVIFPTCTSSRRYPTSVNNRYYECVDSENDGSYQLVIRACSSGQIFDSGTLECVEGATSPTTTIASVTVPACTGSSRFPTPERNQYFECTETSDGSYELVVKTCLSEEIFDRVLLECVFIYPTCRNASRHRCQVDNMYYECTETDSDSYELIVRQCSSGQIFNITTLECETVFPECSGLNKYICPVHDRYYECGEADDGSYQLIVETCSSGTVFDNSSLNCTTASAIPTCTGLDLYPSPVNNMYYECTASGGSFALVIRTCATGELFDVISLQCVDENIFPSCTSSSKYASPLNNSYYECSESDDGSYILIVESCSSGQIFNTTSLQCENIIPTCSRPGRHPSSVPNRYYECVETDDESYEIIIKACSSREVFDGRLGICVPRSIFPVCRSSTRYPSPLRNAYYECVKENESYELIVRSCSDGEVFDSNSLQCINETNFPICIGKDRFSSPVNNMYYECVEIDDGSYELIVRTCSPGDIFDNVFHQCISKINYPTCSSQRRYRSSDRNRYYRCIENNGGYELVVKTCSSGEVFDGVILQCVVDVILPECTSSKRHPCQVHNRYYECEETDGNTFELIVKTCPDGEVFNATSLECNVESTVPTCTRPQKYSCPANDKYYECVENGDSYGLVVGTCPSGEIFDSILHECIPQIIFPTCASPSKHLGPIHNRYYECIENDAEYELIVRTCPNGTVYDIISHNCVVNVIIPKCSSSSRHPCQVHNRYYECEESDGNSSYALILRKCPDGQVFNAISLECGVEDTVPTCTRPRRYPSPANDKYYECVETDEDSYEIVIRTCRIGQIFDSIVHECIVEIDFPVCNRPYRHQGPKHDRYYECVENDASYELIVRTCPLGTIYDSTSNHCIINVILPECSSANRHPCQVHSRYYDCEEDDDNSYELIVRTCSDGQVFNATSLECEVDDTVPTCTRPQRYPSPDNDKYYECVETDDDSYEVVVRTCSSGEIFDSITLKCVPEITFPTCNRPYKHSGPRPDKYYECAKNDSDYELIVRTCPRGTVYDSISRHCIVYVNVPECSSSSRHPCQVHNRYFDCEEDDDDSYELIVRTCPDEQVFNATSLECEVDDTVPTCTRPQRYPSPDNDKYYECVETDDDSYEVVVRTCSSGEIFDSITYECVLEIYFPTCNRPSRHHGPRHDIYYDCIENDSDYDLIVRTCPRGTVYDSISHVCTVNVILPECTSLSKYPCQVNNRYYECEEDDGSDSFELIVKTCPDGQVFNDTSLECEVEVIVPTCTRPRRYSYPDNDKYYECVKTDNNSYAIVIRTCSSGEIFDSITHECVPDITFPTCNIPSRHRCPRRNRYYECVQNDADYELIVRTCPSGEIYDSIFEECVVFIIFPVCTDSNSHPCQVHNKYFACQAADDDTYELIIRTCSDDQTFNRTSLECNVESTVPKCTRPRRYSSPQNNKYYECLETSDDSYEVVVQTCPSGEIFDSITHRCISEIIFPTCSSPSRHSCPDHRRYYECDELDDGSYELIVRTCPRGEIFDNATLECISWESTSTTIDLTTATTEASSNSIASGTVKSTIEISTSTGSSSTDSSSALPPVTTSETSFVSTTTDVACSVCNTV